MRTHKPFFLCQVYNLFGGSSINNVSYVDPMYSKIELLPSDKALLLQKQRAAQDMILPHSHVLQFFESHFSAVRLDNIQNQRLFYRLTRSTTTGLMGTRGHPLAREIHFRVVLFGLKVLRQCTFQTEFSLWKLKDQILSAGLSWFKHSPRYIPLPKKHQ